MEKGLLFTGAAFADAASQSISITRPEAPYRYAYNDQGSYTVIYGANNPDGETVVATADSAEKAAFLAKAANFYNNATEGKRPLHTMTAEEFSEWTNGVIGKVEEGEWFEARKKNVLFKSLFHLFSFLATYGNFNSLTWLTEHDFDISFSEAKKDGKAML